MTMDKIDALIDSLSDELEPVAPMGHPLVRMLPLLLVSFCYVVAVIAIIGLRHDWMIKMLDDMGYVFELSLALGVFVTAGLALGWLAIPDMRGQQWITVIPLTLAGVFLFWACLRLCYESSPYFHFHLGHCALDGVFMLMIPLAILTLFLRKGATTHPRLAGVMTILSFSGLSWTGLRLTCGADNFSHAFLMHFLPFVAIGVLFGLFARKIFRW